MITMVNFLHILAIILAGISVAIADALIKKTAITGNFWLAFKNPWMIAVIILYAVQIAFFVYVFAAGWNLGIVGNLQTVFYSITVVLAGILLFGETLTAIQVLGIALAIIGVFLMNV